MPETKQDIHERLINQNRYENDAVMDPITTAVVLIGIGVVVKIGIEMFRHIPWITKLLPGN